MLRDSLDSVRTSLELRHRPMPHLDDVELQSDEDVSRFKPVHRTPLPKLQLAILCAVRLSEPIAYTQIFPYINHMVEELHVSDKSSDIGFYSGTVDSLFAVAQLFTIYQWGRLSDRIGRRPVIIMGLMGIAVSTLFFGISSSFRTMIISRAMAGALSGNGAVIQSILGEITDETNQAQAFPLTGAFWLVGATIGPLIGGTFSHPADRYPKVFGRFEFLKEQPYFLPCFISAIITAVSIVFAVFFLEETLPSKVQAKRGRSQESYQLVATQRPSSPDPEKSPVGTAIRPTVAPPTGTSAWTLLCDQRVRTVLISAFLLAFIDMCYNVVIVLFAYTPLELGGLERKPSEIGTALSVTGIIGIFLALFGFQYLHNRFGNLPLYAGLMCLYPILFIGIPMIGTVARSLVLPTTAVAKGGEFVTVPTPQSSWAYQAVWGALTMNLMIQRVAGMAFSSNMILVKAVAPDQQSLGGAFGLYMSVACIARAVGPSFVSALFAWSIDTQLMAGNFVWVVMTAISIVGVIVNRGLKDMPQ